MTAQKMHQYTAVCMRHKVLCDHHSVESASAWILVTGLSQNHFTSSVIWETYWPWIQSSWNKFRCDNSRHSSHYDTEGAQVTCMWWQKCSLYIRLFSSSSTIVLHLTSAFVICSNKEISLVFACHHIHILNPHIQWIDISNTATVCTPK